VYAGTSIRVGGAAWRTGSVGVAKAGRAHCATTLARDAEFTDLLLPWFPCRPSRRTRAWVMCRRWVTATA